MADGQHSRTDGGVPAAGRETARPIPPAGRRACPELSRRALLGAVCAAPVLSRHPGLDPGSTFSSPSAPRPPQGRWIPDQVRDDDQSSAVTIWDRALARFHTAQAAVDAASGEPDQDRYDALLDSATDALRALLALPAPDPAAIAAKLDIIVPHLAWELTGSEDCLEILRQDARRFAAIRF